MGCSNPKAENTDLTLQAENTDVVMFHIGTNNWQRQGESAPGSGILHEMFHKTFNSMRGVKCYSMYPSKVQTDPTVEPGEFPKFKIFKLQHDIPICESASPNSSFRWHSMDDAQFDQYQQRLANEICAFLDEIEAKEGKKIDYLISHHAFTNAMTAAKVLELRKDNRNLKHFNFVHGTALKMYLAEMDKENSEYPERFLPLAKKSGVFNGTSKCSGIWVNSQDYIEKFSKCFPEYPKTHLVYSQIGINNTEVFKPAAESEKAMGTFLDKYLDNPGADTCVKDVKRLVTFVGKFADWKRVDAMLYAAKEYEAQHADVGTFIVGTGPEDAIKLYKDLATKLDLKRCRFLGSRGQKELAEIFSMSEVGVFPSYNEPFGMVFLECMACGTPVIGANSGGPKEFVKEEQGKLVEEEADWKTEEGAKRLGVKIAAAVSEALNSNWKSSKGKGCVDYVAKNFSSLSQCQKMLDEMKNEFGGSKKTT